MNYHKQGEYMKTECKSNATRGVAGEQLELDFGRPDGEIEPTRRYSVVITDTRHDGDPGDEYPDEMMSRHEAVIPSEGRP